jgi:hypothetical protein
MLLNRNKLAARLFDRKSFRIPGLAEVSDWTEETARFFWGTEGLAELHEGGIENPGMPGIEEAGRGFP